MASVDSHSETGLVSNSTFEEEHDGQEEKEELAVLQNSFRYMRLHGILPRREEALKASHIRTAAVASLILSTITPVVAMTIGDFVHILIDNIDRPLGESLSVFFTIFGNVCSMLTFLKKPNRIIQLCKKLSDFKTFGKPTNFDKTNSMLNRLSLAYRAYVLVGSLIFIMISQLEAPACKRKNEGKGLMYDLCGLPYGVYVPFRMGSLKPLMFCYQVYIMFLVVGGGTPILFCTVEIASHIVLRIPHLCEKLTNMFDVDAHNEMRLRHCIKYHQFILGIVNDFNEIYSIILGSHVMMIAILLASVGSSLVQETSPKDVIFLTGWLILLFVICYSGQIVSSSSDTLAIAATNSQWYTAKVKDQKVFLFLLTMSQQTMYVYGAPLAIMSFPLMVQLLKASYSYMTLLISDD